MEVIRRSTLVIGDIIWNWQYWPGRADSIPPGPAPAPTGQ